MLNILIPSIPERKDRLDVLLAKLRKQIEYCERVHKSLGDVKIIVDDSKKFLDGGLSIGDKRNELLYKSTENYICFLDDDDGIAPDYTETLLRLCNEDKDVCTFKSLFVCDDYWNVIDMQLGNENQQVSAGVETKRNAWHICPIRRSIATQVRFDSLNHNEDWTWMQKVLPLIKTEAKTNKIIHNYNHLKEVSEADKILNENAIS